jgi:hypothetical protein
MASEALQHPWLGVMWPHGADQLLAQIEIDPVIRPARANGETDAEVLITLGSAQSDAALDTVLATAVERIRAALADLDSIRAFAVEHAPRDWRRHYEAIEGLPLRERLFVESFAVTSPTEMEISFDFGDLDMLVVRVDAQGRGQDVRIVA